MVREHLHLRINGQPYRVSGDDAFLSLSDFLRTRLSLVGTKIVCSEGDCGACTVLVARWSGGDTNEPAKYEPLDACITWMFQLDHAHVISIEGLADRGTLHPVQQAMVDCHGSQCGFCTPGFVMAMTGMMENNTNGCIDDMSLRRGLSGNLCRCTGYVQIVEAARCVAAITLQSLTSRYPTGEMVKEWKSDSTTVLIKGSGDRELYIPSTVETALKYLHENPAAKIISGGTDVGVQVNKGLVSLAKVLYLGGLSSLSAVTQQGGRLSIGAAATWTQVMDALAQSLPCFTDLLSRFGAPQIRNAGTIGGNIINGSSIADCLPLLFVTDAKLRLLSARGQRIVAITEFYRGYRKTDMQQGELLASVDFELPAPDQHLRLYKISRRRDLDISTFTAAILLTLAGTKIETARIAYGGVGPVVLRLPRTERMLTGSEFNEHTMQAAGENAREEIAPISDVRASADYRLALAQTILLKAYHDITASLATAPTD